ncbi:hypothetical protein ACIGC1_00385 [Peribacillus butanolivorans]|uniref:hypothetical protein n=2 Tax=Peribacillus butanolivorans TaxID=421767 RepID=UPI0037C5DB24
MEDFNWGAFLGITLGIICGLTGLWWGRRAAAKQRGLDERFDLIRTRARASSWFFPIIRTCFFFLLLLFGVKLSVAAVLGILLFIHLGSWAIFVLYYQAKL